MKPKQFSWMMKTVIIALGVFGAAFYFYFVPVGLQALESIKRFTEKSIFLPWLIGVILTCIPCYAVLVLAWLMAQSVKNDTQFSHKNSGRLKKIAACALADGAFFFLMNIVFLAVGINIPAVALLSLLVLLVAVAFAAVATVLSGMVEKAAVLQEENDLTI